MARACCVRNCINRERKVKDKSVSFHTFPNNPTVRTKWIESLGRDNFIPTLYHKICSQHFIPSDYLRTEPTRILKKTAVPTVFDPLFILIKSEEDEEEEEEEEEEEDVDIVDNYLQMKQDIQVKEEIIETEPEVTINEPYQPIKKENDENVPISSNTTVNLLKLRQKMADSLNGLHAKPGTEPHKGIEPKKHSLAYEALYTQKGRKRFPIFIGDFKEEDFECPQYAKLMWNIAKRLVARKNKQLKILRMQNRRLIKKIDYLNEALLKVNEQPNQDRLSDVSD